MSPAINFARRYKGLISVAPEKKTKKKKTTFSGKLLIDKQIKQAYSFLFSVDMTHTGNVLKMLKV